MLACFVAIDVVVVVPICFVVAVFECVYVYVVQHIQPPMREGVQVNNCWRACGTPAKLCVGMEETVRANESIALAPQAMGSTFRM